MNLESSTPTDQSVENERGVLTVPIGTVVVKRWQLMVALLVLTGIIVFQAVMSFQQRLRHSFAEEQIEIFEEMKRKSSDGDLQQSAQCLDYVVNYYPSGTKQVQGSSLDRIVENNRKIAISEIIRTLRRKSGIDLGDAPEPWISKFKGRKQAAEK